MNKSLTYVEKICLITTLSSVQLIGEKKEQQASC